MLNRKVSKVISQDYVQYRTTISNDIIRKIDINIDVY